MGGRQADRAARSVETARYFQRRIQKSREPEFFFLGQKKSVLPLDAEFGSGHADLDGKVSMDLKPRPSHEAVFAFPPAHCSSRTDGTVPVHAFLFSNVRRLKPFLSDVAFWFFVYGFQISAAVHVFTDFVRGQDKHQPENRRDRVFKETVSGVCRDGAVDVSANGDLPRPLLSSRNVAINAGLPAIPSRRRGERPSKSDNNRS